MRSCLLLLGSFLAFQANAQQPAPIPAKAFLPDGHDTILVADLAAMRASGVFDDLEATLMGASLPHMEKELGFPLARLDRATMVVESPGREGEPVRRLVLFEGNAELAVPDRVWRGQYEEETLAGHTLLRNVRSTFSVFTRPQPSLQVMGHEDTIVPVLGGKRGPGAPSADVMSLLSTRGGNLAFAVIACTDPRARREVLEPLLPDAKWPDGDAPTHLLVRARCTGEADDPHVEIEAVLRHRLAGPGLAASEQSVDAALGKLREDGRWQVLRPLLARLQKRTDRSDLCLSVDLGRTREAAGYFAMAGAALMFARTAAVEAAAAAAVPVPVRVAPVPQPK